MSDGAPVMSIDLKAIAQAEFAKIVAAHSNSVVSVVSGANTANCIRDMRSGDATLSDDGETGSSVGKVFCNVDTIGALTNGQSITVGGEAANVMLTETDPMGAVVEITYTLRKPR